MDGLAGFAPSSIPMDDKAFHMPAPDRRERLRVWLDESLKRSGKRAIHLAAALDVPPSRVTEMRQGRRNIKAQELSVIAEFLGVEPPDYDDRNGNPADLQARKKGLTLYRVVGVAEAGAFRQQDMLQEALEAFIEAPAPEAFPSATHYALKIRGDSMDLRGIMDGDHVTAVDYSEIGTPLKNGTVVHVQKSSDGGYLEWTLKEVHAFPDRYELQPRSSNPKHRPYVIPRDGVDAGSDEVRILGIVVGVHRLLTF